MGERIDAFSLPMENSKADHSFYFLASLYELLRQIDGCYAKIPEKYGYAPKKA